MTSFLLNLLYTLLLFQGVSSTITTCYQDDCLRAFQHTSLSAAAFCATYTNTIVTASSTPGFASRCTKIAATPVSVRLSSACTCFVGTPASVSTSATTSSSLPPVTTTFTTSSSSSTGVPSSTSSLATSSPSSTSDGNLIIDGGFEATDSSAWQSLTIDSTISHNGSNSAKIVSSAITQSITIPSVSTAPTIYFSVAAKFLATSGNCNFFASVGSGPFVMALGITTFDWKTYAGTYTLGRGAQTVSFMLDCYVGSGTLWLDDIYLGTAPPS